MKARLHKHTGHYTLLLLMLVLGGIGFFSISYSKQGQFLIGMLMAAGYIIWGVFHHSLEKDLNWKVVVEYWMLSLFALSVLWAFLFI